MNEIEPRYEVTRGDSAKDRVLKFSAWTVPVLLAIVPALIFFVLFLFSSQTPTAFTFLFLSLATLVGGFLLGLIFTGGILYYRSNWLKKVRERIAVDGIKAQEIDWFKNELTTTEKKSLREIEAKNLLLADAFRDTLAARLTATRILRSSKQELLLVERRQNKLKNLKTENSQNLRNELEEDSKKLRQIKSEAEEMRLEAETRLQMIEAASRRGTNLADSELALKKLSARTAELPLALESARMEDEIRRELEKESDEVKN